MMRLARSRTAVGRRVSLLWLLFAGNAAVMVAAAAVLAFTPATIHATIRTGELLGLLGGLVAMLAVDLLFLRGALAPLRRLAELMGAVDLVARPGPRIGSLGRAGSEVALVAEAFDAMLERLEAERRESARRALAAQEAERLRVARELHDELGQTLTAAALRAEGAAAAGGEQGAALGEIAQTLQTSLGEVRRIARELRPEALDDLGLVNALIALCTRVGAHAGAWIEREFDGDLPALGAEADLVVYRVAQEALTNAVRHGRPARIAVTLAREGGEVVLRVRDDGRGLPEPLREGAGLAGMRERAMLIGARLELRGGPGHGAEIVLAVTPPAEGAAP